jgi:uncharacterized protein (DUF302 family)
MEKTDDRVTTRTIPVEHVIMRCSQPFDTVRERLERNLPRLDDGIFVLVRYGEAKRALSEMEAAAPLSIFGFRDHGRLLQIAGMHRRAIQYDIGNPLTASRMTRHSISAALYAPIRVLLREDESAEVAFEYDRPVSVFGQFGDTDIAAVARELDDTLRTSLLAAGS